MHIKKITIKNFKSFGKKVEIPLERGFTVISGPNGSGKSNIIDSIIFCLGLHSSSKVLRAEKLTDLIYSGNGRRLGTAEVEIVFEPDNGEELRISRKVRVTEKNYYSNYYINGKPASHGEVVRVLEKAGIYSDAYNIVMQGDVTRIVEMTPMQRRKIIDDIAGISEFEEKKARAIEELEAVRQNIEKISAILSEVELRLKELERDREEALRYRELLEKKERLENELKAIRRKELSLKLERLRKEVERLQRQKDSAMVRISEIKVEKESIRKELEDVSRRIAETADERYREIQERIADIQAEIEGLRKEEEILKAEIERLNEERMKALLDITKINERLESLRKELENLLLQKVSVEESVDSIKAQIEGVREQIEKLSGEEKELRDEIVSLSEKAEELREGKSELLRERDRIYEGLRRVSIEIEELEGELNRIRNEYSGVKDEIELRRREIERIESQLAREITNKNAIDRKIFDLRNEISAIDEEIKGKELELAKVKAELSAYEATFGRAVELILEAKEKKALPGIFGIVAQLAEVEERYALALEIAAGNALNFIVVENEDDAIRAINYLKQIRGGRATFLPLNKIRKNFEKINLDRKVLSEKGVIDYAVNLVKCEPKFRPVFNFVFRDTLVVDNVENAKRIMDGRRIVTLDGELIEKSGAITGGSVDRKKGLLISKELLEREKKISEEITVLNSKKAFLVGELRKVEDSWREAQSRVKELEESLRNAENDVKVLQARLEGIAAREKEILERIEDRERERRELGQKIGDVEQAVKEVDSELSKIEGRLEELNRKMKGSALPKLTEELERLKSQFSVAREGLIKIESEIEKKELEIGQAERELEDKERRVGEIDGKVSEYGEKIEHGRKKAMELREEMERLREEEETLGEAIKELRRERDALFSKLKDLENEESRLEYDLVGFDEKIRARKEAMGEIEAEIQGLPEMEPSMSRDEAVSELERVESELSKFGEVNMKAIQDYEEVKARWEELYSRKVTLEKEREEILERIERYDRMKKEKFFEVFNAINENFKEVIAKLANGEGELYLDNHDDPFNSGLHMKVKPYGKPVQRLEQMSGGEKSLVALAFIFAIQRYKPAPFYAFDEVDMFLDGVNVARLARMIKEMSSRAQFIVVSLRKPMLEQADAIVGVTMGRDNSSQVTGIRRASMIQ
ncbi:condensin subunit Smc [Geoglobus ahangari]|uniref:Chromosome partition protein Smc n=1 Tax=Geoglobus ahangari TaxID=113653 RepID=A0A0F7IF16_9EURY|nr:chromosome segregation protein SMC [Geoglobus ahangari]AKG91622.1 condensin subunit Smc [Geoglobus ahangari]